MILWIVLTLMIAMVASGLTIPLVRRYDVVQARGGNVEILKSQLADIDSQLASGTISQDDAEGLRIEIRRRLLTESRGKEAPARPLPVRSMPWIAIGLSATVALAAVGLYATMGRPELTDSAASVPAAALRQDTAKPAHPRGDVSAMVEQLEVQLQRSPNNAEGWRMLGWSYMHTNRPADAAKAYQRASVLAPSNADYLSAEGEALATAAGGQVTNDALKSFKAALAIAPGDPRALYYLGVRKDQGGDHKGAMEDWIALLKGAPADAPWAAEVRGFVERTARERGDDIAGRLPPAPAAAAVAPPPGPSAADVAAASQMPQTDRQAMIHGMVDKLAGELKQNPRNADGWVRLMRARMVLGETDNAVTALKDAIKAFADSSKQQSALRDQARALGIPGA